jgi:hypothetical protein
MRLLGKMIALVKLFAPVLIATLSASSLFAETNSFFVHFGIGFAGADPKPVLSTLARFGEPFFVAAPAQYLQLTGRVEKVEQSIKADLLGSTGGQSGYFEGRAEFEKPLLSQGGAASSGVALMWFALSTNSDCTHVIERLKTAIPGIGKSSVTNNDATGRAGEETNRHVGIDPNTGLPFYVSGETDIDPATGLPFPASNAAAIDPITGLPLPPMLKKWRRTSWGATEVNLLRWPTTPQKRGTNEGMVKVFAIDTVYVVTNQFAEGEVNFHVIVFNGPKTQQVYLGWPAQFYIETVSNIVGAELISSSLFWDDSLIPGTDDRVRAIDHFDRRIDMQKELEQERRRTELADVLGRDFFNAGPGASNSGIVKIKNVTVETGLLRLDLESPSGAFTGTVWINLKNSRPVRALRDGKRIFGH